jgi:hypothetical protein
MPKDKPEEDQLDKKIDELITAKFDAALKPILEKLDALTPKEEDKEEKEEKIDKTDSKPIKLATEVLRANLKGRIEKKKLDAMPLNELYIANQLTSVIKTDGIRNPIEQKDKTDSTSDDDWGMEMEE